MNDLSSLIKKNLPNDLTQSVRLFHGRGRLIPALEHIVVDYFAPSILITLFKETEITLMSSLLDSLKDIEIENILVQKRYLPRAPMEAIKGVIPVNSIAHENSLQFHLKFGDSQNIGFFLDMLPGRQMLERISSNKKVLNLFSYTCSLSVAAMKGGASEVVNVDMSKAALSVGESNHRLNNINLSKVKYLPYDIMKSWNNIFKRGPFDIVVIDPPTNQGDSFKVERDYYKIVKRLNEMTAENALIMACLNSPHLTTKFLKDIFLEHAPEYEYQEVLYSAFESMEVNPEEGLKIVVFKRK